MDKCGYTSSNKCNELNEVIRDRNKWREVSEEYRREAEKYNEKIVRDAEKISRLENRLKEAQQRCRDLDIKANDAMEALRLSEKQYSDLLSQHQILKTNYTAKAKELDEVRKHHRKLLRVYNTTHNKLLRCIKFYKECLEGELSAKLMYANTEKDNCILEDHILQLGLKGGGENE